MVYAPQQFLFNSMKIFFWVFSSLSSKSEEYDKRSSSRSTISQTASEAANDFTEARTSYMTAQLKSRDEDSDVYDFTHPKRGLAVIINNETFERGTDFGDRPGSSYDAKSLYDSFKKQGFDVLYHNDLPGWKMLEVLKAGGSFH